MSGGVLLTAALAVMTIVAALSVVLPLLRGGRGARADAQREADAASPASSGEAVGAGRGIAAPATALAVAVAVPVLALLAYQQLSNFDWDTLGADGAVMAASASRAAATAGAVGGEAAGVQEMVAELRRRLERDGGSLQEWQLLGRSLVQFGDYSGAEQALRQAYRQAAGEPPAVVSGVAAEYAEAMILADQRALLADAGTLLEQVLTRDAENPRALWWGGLAAFERGEYASAATRWQRLLDSAQMDSQEMRGVLEQRLALAEQLAAEGAPPPAEIRARMGDGAAPASGAAGGSGRVAAAGAGAAAAGAEPPAADAATGVSLRVAVAMAPGLQATGGSDGAGLPLFVIARQPGGGGPPLAVVRRSSSELPLQLELSDANAMIPGRGISSVDEVEVVARISASGNPIESSGDLWGSRRVSVGEDALVEVTISERTP